MIATGHVNSIAHVIQLAIAPVFLLSGIGALLGVLANRLARAVDRARALEPLVSAPASAAIAERMRSELATLARRARLINRAISLVTLCALLISALIVLLFVGDVLGWRLSWMIAGLFVAAMLALIAGLLCFLREVALATASLRIGVVEDGAPPG